MGKKKTKANNQWAWLDCAGHALDGAMCEVGQREKGHWPSFNFRASQAMPCSFYLPEVVELPRDSTLAFRCDLFVDLGLLRLLPQQPRPGDPGSDNVEGAHWLAKCLGGVGCGWHGFYSNRIVHVSGDCIMVVKDRLAAPAPIWVRPGKNMGQVT